MPHIWPLQTGSSNDFAFQLDQQLGLSPDEFTLIALDLPGCGKSGIRDDLKCEPSREYFEFCADLCASLMSKLGHKTYSLAGWNDGARVASLLAIKCQSRVNALVLWGFAPHMDKSSSLALAKTRDVNTWDENVLKLYTSVYGEQNFSDLWHKYVDFIVASLELPEQFDVRDQLWKIKCPTLILHGAKDPIIDFQTHVKPLEMQIYDSDIVQFRDSAYNIHQADVNQFNRALTTFVTSVRA